MDQRQTETPAWLAALGGILDLEESRGFNNRAVSGGVDRFIERWLEPLNSALATAGSERAVRSGEYGGMTPEQREEWVKGLRGVLFPDSAAVSAGDAAARGNEAPDAPDPPAEPEPPVRELSQSVHPGTRNPRNGHDGGLDSPYATPPPAQGNLSQRQRLSRGVHRGNDGRGGGGSDGGEGDGNDGRETRGSPVAPTGLETAAKSGGREFSDPPYSRPPAGLTVDAPVDRLRGVDAKLSERLGRLGVRSIRDLLYLFPRRHSDYTRVVKIAEVEPDVDCTVIGHVWETREVSLGRGGRLKATEAVLSDETGNVRVIWFGQRYIARSLKTNSRVAISGRASRNQGRLVFESPDYEPLQEGQTPIHTGRLAPVYPLTAGLTGRNLRRLVWQALSQWLGGVKETLPPDIRSRVGIVPLPQAIMQAHFPADGEAATKARRRLAFEELFTLQLAVLSRRRQWSQGLEGVRIKADPQVIGGFIESLPFPLTGAQRRCVDEILEDLKRGSPPMNRLLQGEVGSGKTVVVLTALMAAAAAGYQGAIMVPTEVLAEQHFRTIGNLLSGWPAQCRRNTGSRPTWNRWGGRFPLGCSRAARARGPGGN